MQQVVILKELLDIAAHQDELSWEPFHPGVDIYRLYKDGEGGAAARYFATSQGQVFRCTFIRVLNTSLSCQVHKPMKMANTKLELW
jgi:hypothetical protein